LYSKVVEPSHNNFIDRVQLRLIGALSRYFLRKPNKLRK